MVCYNMAKSPMGDSPDFQPDPRSKRRTQILDSARTQPEASFETLAESLPGVTADDVERVLDEYGDPADGLIRNALMPAWSDGAPNLDLSEKQFGLLQVIADHPQATQRELAEQMDLSAATISSRASSIERFEWENRQEFVEALSTKEPPQSVEDPPMMSWNEPELQTKIAQLTQRVTAIEQRLETDTEGGETDQRLDDLELLQKVIHACIQTDTISEDEELRVLQALMR